MEPGLFENSPATPTNPIPTVGKPAARTAAPHPPKTSQNVPKNSAAARLPIGTFEPPFGCEWELN